MQGSHLLCCDGELELLQDRGLFCPGSGDMDEETRAERCLGGIQLSTVHPLPLVEPFLTRVTFQGCCWASSELGKDWAGQHLPSLLPFASSPCNRFPGLNFSCTERIWSGFSFFPRILTNTATSHRLPKRYPSVFDFTHFVVRMYTSPWCLQQPGPSRGSLASDLM